jgi:hypothetical protein
MSYERDMAIDVTALDVEWTEQAELAMKYGRLWADAQDAASRAEEQVKYVRSKLILKATKHPEDCLGKGINPTDTKVESYYRTHPEYIAAKDDWLDKVNEANLLSIAKNEISFTRKSALENLVTLHGQQYFASPNVPRNIKEAVESRRAHRKEENQRENSKVRKVRRS